MDSSREEERVIGSEVQASAHACIVCLMEIGSIGGKLAQIQPK